MLSVNTRLLVVDDDALARRVARRLLKPLGGPVDTAGSAEEGLRLLAEHPVGLVLTDLRMPGMDGDQFLAEIRRQYPEMPVLVMTNHATVDIAVDLMKLGATDFITKPLDEGALLPRIQLALQRAEKDVELNTLRRKVARAQPSHNLVGGSSTMRELLDRIPLAAHSDAPVLVTGESGTGKELVARALHDASDRAGAFVPVNCGALPSELLESELFGHAKGAFTGATRDRAGLVVEADRGTLLLDEIGEMPLQMQVKLLRFLQEGVIRSVGSERSRKVDVRVICATHRDLKEMVAEGSFREDLYYRLDVIRLRLPPLRERAGDVPLLAEHFLGQLARRTSRPGLSLTPEALGAMAKYSWPGNVRELQNVLHRAAVFATGLNIEASQLDFDPVGSGPAASGVEGPDLAQPFREAKQAAIDGFERAYVEGQLAAVAGNVAEAARRSGKDRKTFWQLLQRHRIEPDAFRP